MGIGCLVYLLLLGGLYWLEKLWLEGLGVESLEVAAGVLAISGVMFVGCANRLRKAIARIERTGFHPERWQDGELIRFSGKVRPVGGVRMLTPVTQKPAVAFSYEFYVDEEDSHQYGFAGLDAGAFEIRTMEGGLRVKGFPLLMRLGREVSRGESWYQAAAKWLGSREWEEVKMPKVGPVVGYLSSLKGEIPKLPVNQMNRRLGGRILGDGPEGIVSRLFENKWVFEEKYLAPGAEVTVEGTYVANPPAIDLSFDPERPNHKISLGVAGKQGLGWPIFGMLYFGG